MALGKRAFRTIALAALLGVSVAVIMLTGQAGAQHPAGSHGDVLAVAPMEHDHEHAAAWEGSAEGVAYSERNHHIAGLLVILMGLAETSYVMRLPSLAWARLLLPSAMLLAGIFVMIWSDHEAWPIGSLSFADTFFGHDAEILQHKAYGILALAVGSIELFRRLGRAGHRAWATPLPLMAIVGGLMLFGHSHGAHPSAHKIAVHHAIMGTMAVTAGSSRLFSSWIRPASGLEDSKWEWLWAGLILLIGAQLLIYSE